MENKEFKITVNGVVHNIKPFNDCYGARLEFEEMFSKLFAEFNPNSAKELMGIMYCILKTYKKNSDFNMSFKDFVYACQDTPQIVKDFEAYFLDFANASTPVDDNEKKKSE